MKLLRYDSLKFGLYDTARQYMKEVKYLADETIDQKKRQPRELEHMETKHFTDGENRDPQTYKAKKPKN